MTAGGEAIEGEPIAGALPLTRQPQSVLFACRMNSIRSPMAAAIMRRYFRRLTYIASVGILKGEHDPFVDVVMAEIGIDMSKHQPMTFDELEELEGLNFDLVISLSPEAHHRAIELTRTLSVDVEYWPTPEPDCLCGNREQCLAVYREVRDLLVRPDPREICRHPPARPKFQLIGRRFGNRPNLSSKLMDYGRSSIGTGPAPAGDENMVERRRFHRVRTLLGARIAFGRMTLTMDCVIRDLTPAGARLRLPSTIGVPSAFQLLLDRDGRQRRCTVIWRSETELGVAFAGPRHRGTTAA